VPLYDEEIEWLSLMKTICIDKQFLYTDITDKSSFGSNVNF